MVTFTLRLLLLIVLRHCAGDMQESEEDEAVQLTEVIPGPSYIDEPEPPSNTAGDGAGGVNGSTWLPCVDIEDDDYILGRDGYRNQPIGKAVGFAQIAAVITTTSGCTSWSAMMIHLWQKQPLRIWLQAKRSA